jgi:hypothetical protein
MSDIRAVAKQYIESAWSVVPLNPGEKRASVKWQSTTYKPSDFNDDSNIAVKMGDASNGLVDVDCDHPFAVAAAKELLPITGRVFRRSSKPSSHYLFVCPDIKTTQFTDVKATDGTSQMLVEIRSTNGYTMLPPSIHPSGERVVCPGRILHDFRRTAVRNLELAGVPRSVAMKLTGHLTESVYRRYAIADQRDLRVAVERLDAMTSAR